MIMGRVMSHELRRGRRRIQSGKEAGRKAEREREKVYTEYHVIMPEMKNW